MHERRSSKDHTEIILLPSRDNVLMLSPFSWLVVTAVLFVLVKHREYRIYQPGPVPKGVKNMLISILESFAAWYTEGEWVDVGIYQDEVKFEIRNGVPIIGFEGVDMASDYETVMEWRSTVAAFATKDTFPRFCEALKGRLPPTHRGDDVVCIGHSRGAYLMSAWCKHADVPPRMAVFVGSPGMCSIAARECRTSFT